MVPLVLLLLSSVLTPRAFAAVCVGLIASPFVSVTVSPWIAAPWLSPSTLRLARLSGHELVIDVAQGPARVDYARRLGAIQFVQGFASAAEANPWQVCGGGRMVATPVAGEPASYG
jgi:hypothetical protein